MMKVMKVFDCQDMPKELRDHFYSLWDDKGNDTYVQWGVQDTIYDEGDPSILIDEWLIANGALPKPAYEQVLIKY